METMSSSPLKSPSKTGRLWSSKFPDSAAMSPYSATSRTSHSSLTSPSNAVDDEDGVASPLFKTSRAEAIMAMAVPMDIVGNGSANFEYNEELMEHLEDLQSNHKGYDSSDEAKKRQRRKEKREKLVKNKARRRSSLHHPASQLEYDTQERAIQQESLKKKKKKKRSSSRPKKPKSSTHTSSEKKTIRKVKMGDGSSSPSAAHQQQHSLSKSAHVPSGSNTVSSPKSVMEDELLTAAKSCHTFRIKSKEELEAERLEKAQNKIQMIFLEQRNKERRRRLEAAKERIRRQKEERQRQLELQKQQELQELNRPRSEEERRENALKWYRRCGMPHVRDFKARIRCMKGADITLEDVDLLPWKHGRVDPRVLFRM